MCAELGFGGCGRNAHRVVLTRQVNSTATFCGEFFPELTCCFGSTAGLEAQLEGAFQSIMTSESKVRNLLDTPKCRYFIKRLLCTVCQPGNEEFLELHGSMSNFYTAKLSYCNSYCFQLSDHCSEAVEYVCGEANKNCVWGVCDVFLETVRLKFPKFLFTGDGVSFKEKSSKCFLVSSDAPGRGASSWLVMAVAVGVSYISALL